MKSGFIVKFLQKLRDSVQKLLMFIWGKARDPQSGRLPISNSSLRMIGVTALGVFFVFVVVNNYMRNHRNAGSFDDYTKEIQNDTGIAARPIEKSEIFDTDPTKTLPYQEPSAVGASSSAEGMMTAPSKDECLNLIQRMKDGEPNFTLQEQRQVDICIADNTAGLSSDELAMAKALNDKTLSPEQRDAIRNQWAGNPGKLEKDPVLGPLKPLMTPGGPEKVSNKLSEAGVNITPEQMMDLAKQIQNSADKAAKDALKKALSEQPLSKKDASAFSKYAPSEEAEEKSSISSFLGGSSTGGKEEALREVADRIRSKQSEIESLKAELAESQAAARAAAEKMARGKVLNADESAAVRDATDKSQALAKAQEELSKDADELKRLSDELKEVLANANSISEEIPSGTFELRLDADGKPIKRGKGKRSAKAGDSGQTEKKVLSIKELEAIRVKETADLLTDGTKISGKLLNADLFGKDPIDANKLVTSFTEKDVLRLRSSMKIAAILDSEIYLASNSPGQQVRVKLMMDVYDVETAKVALPKGTVLIGTASSFNDETGILELTFSKASVGKKTFDFSMKVGSADGSMGLKGDIYDTRGRRLLAALITSFSSGVLNWFSQNVVQQYQDSKQAQLAITGAALGGAAEVGNKIAAMYASDLNNAPTIYHAPRGTPVILYPDDQ